MAIPADRNVTCKKATKKLHTRIYVYRYECRTKKCMVMQIITDVTRIVIKV
jgi:hypothetical protein